MKQITQKNQINKILIFFLFLFYSSSIFAQNLFFSKDLDIQSYSFGLFQETEKNTLLHEKGVILGLQLKNKKISFLDSDFQQNIQFVFNEMDETNFYDFNKTHHSNDIYLNYNFNLSHNLFHNNKISINSLFGFDNKLRYGIYRNTLCETYITPYIGLVLKIQNLSIGLSTGYYFELSNSPGWSFFINPLMSKTNKIDIKYAINSTTSLLINYQLLKKSDNAYFLNNFEFQPTTNYFNFQIEKSF